MTRLLTLALFAALLYHLLRISGEPPTPPTYEPFAIVPKPERLAEKIA